MKKEKKTTETLGSQGNQKINQKEKDKQLLKEKDRNI